MLNISKKAGMENGKGKMAALMVALFCFLLPPLAHAEAPKKVKDGVEFSYGDAKAKTVHIAGDFNNWAENQEGKVTRPEFLMMKDKSGVWKKIVKIGGGKHIYKFVINGSEWIADPSVKTTDKDGNSVITVEGPAQQAAPSPSAGGASRDSAPREVAGGVKFMYKGNAKKVNVAGEFNKWNADAHPMKEEKPGLWSAIVPMPAGDQPYKFFVDGQWMQDPSNPSKAKEGEYDNSIVKVSKGVSPVQTAATGQKSAIGGGSGPKKVAGGWEFSFAAPTAKSVHIAGDFNNWADNESGLVTKPEYLMKKGADGIWRKTVALSPGQHIYKFVVDGSQWSPDSGNTSPRDKDDNSVLAVGEKSKEEIQKELESAAGGPKKVAGGWEFSYKAPTAKSIHIAGDFNSWADNDSGLVSRPEHLMKKGADGIWRKTIALSPGQHAYKFVVDGTQWFPDPENPAPRDKDDNSLFLAK